MRKAIILSGMYLLISCTGSENALPESVLDKTKMAEVLTDLHIAQSIAGTRTISDTALPAGSYRDAVYSHHGITHEDFRRSIEYYSTQPELLRDVYDSVIVNLSKLQGVMESEQ